MIGLQRFVAQLVFPVSLCCILLLVGVALLWLTRRQKTGRILVSAATLLLLLISNNYFADFVLGPLEQEVPPLAEPATLNRADQEPVKWVVVLGGGYLPDEELPLSTRPGETLLMRLVEGIVIHKQVPGSKLVLCQEHPAAGADLARLAGRLGVNEGDVVTSPVAASTAEEVGFLKTLIGEGRFVLVTSAAHMPRAVRLFRDQGMQPIPAPTDYLVRSSAGPWDHLPTAAAIRASETASYEFLGSAWAWLTR